MRGKTKDWLKKKIFSKCLKLSGRFSKFTKNERVLENVDSQNVQIQKILRDHMGFFLLASSSSSLLRLLLECVAVEFFLAIFDAIFFHIWGVLEPRKESESSASLLVREILFCCHFILFLFFCGDWSFSKSEEFWMLISKGAEIVSSSVLVLAAAFFFFSGKFLWWFLPNRRSFLGKKLVRSQ